MGKYDSVEALGVAVDEAENEVLLCDGIDLRDACGESRLKAQARERIKESLASRGLVAVPGVPEDQEHPVYLTRLSSPTDLLYKAFSRPSAAALAQIRGAVGGTGEIANQQDSAKQVAELIDEARTELDKLIGVKVTD
jgi:hypothetical protein